MPVEVQEAEIGRTGLKYDRSFILVKDIEPGSLSGVPSTVTEHLTIKTLSKLCLFQPSMRSTISSSCPTLVVKHTITGSETQFDLSPDPESLLNFPKYTVEIFGTRAVGVDMGDDIATWFSRHLQQPARLLYIGGDGYREGPAPALVPRRSNPRTGVMSWIKGPEEEALHPQKIQFADAAPLLITTMSSEREAASRMSRARDGKNAADDENEDGKDEDIILRFRSNIQIDNTRSEASSLDNTSVHPLSAPYAEEHWRTLLINPTTPSPPDSAEPIRLDLVFNTVRCASLNVDFHTGELLPPQRQLYKALATRDRRVNAAFPLRPCFGRYAFAEPFGALIRVGDEVHVDDWVGEK